MAEDRRAVDDSGEVFEESRRADPRERRRIALPGFADRPCRSLVHQEAAAMVKGSSPASRVRTGTSGICRGASPATAFAIAAICAGVEPQQPPRMLTWPCSAHSRTSPAVVSGCSSYRSEEHTSELQSLMRISYAVFC